MSIAILMMLLLPICSANKLELTLTQAQRTAWPISLELNEKLPDLFSRTLRQDVSLSGVMVESTENPKAEYKIHPCEKGVCLSRADHPGTVIAFQGNGSNIMLAHQVMDYFMKDTLNIPGWFHNQLAYVTVSGNNYTNRTYQLEVSDITGKETHTVFSSKEPIMSPAWSPHGDQLAYVSYETNQPTLWVQDLATGKRTLMSQEPGINGAPSWSPDGNRLAYVMTVSGHPKIYVKNLRSKDSTQITFGRSIDTEPVWSTDGSMLYFTSNRSGSPQIYSMRLKDKHVERVTYQGPYHVRPTISKNKKLLTLTKVEGRWGVMLHDLEHDTTKLLSVSGTEDQPMIHPEGYFAVYTKRFGVHTMLEIAHVTDPIRYRLPAESGTVRFPTWSQT